MCVYFSELVVANDHRPKIKVFLKELNLFNLMIEIKLIGENDHQGRNILFYYSLIRSKQD